MKIPDSWTFNDKGVAAEFSSHVREQLPWYDVVSDALVSVARHYIPRDGLVYDIGASNGNIGRRLADTLSGRSARLIGIEESVDFMDTYQAPGELMIGDASNFNYERFDVAICFLVLMFMTKTDREYLLQDLQDRVKPGGAIILVERFVPEAGYRGIVTSRMSIAGKVQVGVDSREIIAKELSLAGMQRPLSAEEIPEGYEWFRMGDFRGFVIEG